MCGIVGGITNRNIVNILLEGLRKLEYRGYDSAGLVVHADSNGLVRRRAVGKIAELSNKIDNDPVSGNCGIAHTRWATHGAPTENNAHPHLSKDTIAVVHNGIIENHQQLKEELEAKGYTFDSETDSEVIPHLIDDCLKTNSSLLEAVKAALLRLKGAYALAVLSITDKDQMIVARQGSPLVIGVGIDEYFASSDIAALLPVTQRFIYLEDGDIAELSTDKVTIYDDSGEVVDRDIIQSKLTNNAVDKGIYRHFMLKEIYEQPLSIANTLEGRISSGHILEEAFGLKAKEIFDSVKRIKILACGTSYHAGMISSYWFEAMAGIPCSVEVASEFRYRKPVVEEDSLLVVISQSGETADTISALKEAKRLGYKYTLVICNVPESTLVRDTDLNLMTRAGPEIGVASTKAFTTQLVALLMLVVVLGRRFRINEVIEKQITKSLLEVSGKVEEMLKLDDEIASLSHSFANKHHALFLGRGAHYPVAMEGALKLKEISYIHAEAYPAGELKHGPLALVDEKIPVIAVAPNNDLLDKLKANLREVSARGGKLIVFTDESVEVESGDDVTVINMHAVNDIIAPIIHSVPLQLLAYHVALIKGTDVDQPRNLAKSVTVE